MGFYGNIKNTSRTQFSFDKIYPNRYSLDSARNGQKSGAEVDDIYAGRFVLVEYDTDMSKDLFDRAVLLNGVLYAGLPTSADGTLVPITLESGNDTFYLIEGKNNFDEIVYNEDETITYPKDKLVQLLGTTAVKEGEYVYSYDSEKHRFIKSTDTNGNPLTQKAFSYAEFKEVSQDGSNYYSNYNIDINKYGVSRGYDSTVWQKVYNNGVGQYVMIAELNSVVPTFALSADAPSLFPNIPHFDSDSTNIYYKLHWQPQWGLRLKASDPTLRTPYLQTNGEAYASTGSTANTALVRENDTREYPSDETTTWSHSVFDNNNQYQKTEYFVPKDGNGHSSWMDEDAAKNYGALSAAVYYNKAGFDPKTITYSQDKTYNGWGTTGLVSDEISITPTGVSGHQYNSHATLGKKSTQPDTQEISIMLPSVGDTIASVWDIVYGGRNIDPDATSRNMDVSWYNAKAVSNKQGIRLIKSTSPGHYTYNTDNAGTLAGILNSAQDLMGMIITDKMPENAEDANDQYIYYDSEKKKYYFKHKTYNYTTQYTGGSNIPKDYSFYQREELKKWDDNYYYIDTSSGVGDEYISENKFYSDKKYVLKDNVQSCMQQINLSEAYQPDGTFYYRSSDSYSTEKASAYNYFVASTDSYDPEKKYYEFKRADNQIEKGEAIYVPGMYYTASYKQVTLTKNTYEPGLYYIKYGGTSGATFYFELDLSKEDFTANWSSIVNSDLVICSEQNYKIRTPFEQETIFKRGYSLATDLTADPSVKYYKLKISTGGSNAFYTLVSSTAVETVFSSSENIYYIVDTKEEANREIDGVFYKLETSDYAVDGRQYYLIQDRYELQQGTDIVNIKDEDVEEITNMLSINDYKKGSVESGQGTDLFYTYKDGAGIVRYIEVTYSNLSKAYNSYTQDYELVVMEYSQIGSPYYKNKYYYQVTDEDSDYYGSYLIDNNDGLTADRVYYDFKVPENLTDDDLIGKQLKGFFAAGEYYVEYPEGSGTYITANDEFKESEKYYNRSTTLYVTKDPQGIYDEGSIWPLEIKTVPEGVELSTREDAWEYQELEGLNDKLTTMYGALLRLQKTLNEQDTLTRDSDTIRGAINLINDITHRFSDLIPGQFTIVDDYGRMHSAELTTAQGLKYAGRVGEEEAQVEDKAEVENALITVNIDSNYENPSIQIIHTKPESIETSNDAIDLNDRKGDDITLQTLVYEDAGHIAKERNVTYTLPFGFKTINLGDESTATEDLGSNTQSIVADNSKDTMTLAAANKWIKLAGTENDGTKEGPNNLIQIGHIVQLISPSTDTQNLNDDGDTFEIQTESWDEAGHITSYTTKTYTLPYSFKTISLNNSSEGVSELITNTDSIVADKSKDTMTLAAANKWIRLAGSDNTINIAHTLSTLTSGKQNNSQTATPTFGATFNVPVITTDEAGHITAFETETVTIPKGSYSNTGNAGIITGVNFVDATGAISTTSSFLGSVALGSYSEPDSLTTDNKTTISASGFSSTTSLSDAIKALDSRIMIEEQNRINIIDSLDYEKKEADGEFLSSITQDNGKISVSTTTFDPKTTIIEGTSDNAPEIGITINTKSSNNITLTKATTGVYGVTKLTDSYNGSNADLAVTGAAISDAISTLKANNTTDIDSGETIASWSEENGKVNITTQSIEITTSQVTDFDDRIAEIIGTDADTEDSETIKGLLQKIKALEERIAALEA